MKKPHFSIVFIAFAMIASCNGSVASAQSPRGMEVGSAEHIAYLANQQNAYLMEIAMWNSAKKIHEIPPGAEKLPREDGFSGSPLTSETGQLFRNEGSCYTVRQVTGDETMILSGGRSAFILDKYNTSEIIDGERVVLIGVLEVTGTKTYGTVSGGTNTVKVVRFLTEDEIPEAEAALKKRLEKEAEEKRIAELKQRLRTWTSSDGSYTVDAAFIDFKNGLVLLEKLDGTKLSVKPSVFSRVDQKFYRDKLRERAEQEVERKAKLEEEERKQRKKAN